MQNVATIEEATGLEVAEGPEVQAACDACMSASGQGGLMDAMGKHPVAVAERKRSREFIRKMGLDHVFLARYTGTDFCQWHGRAPNGRFYEFGRILRIV